MMRLDLSARTYGAVHSPTHSGNWFGLVLCSLLLGCGSSHAQQPAEQASAPSPDPAEDAAVSEAPLDSTVSPAVARADCSDGTCFPCGEGECPQGAYCDREGTAGPACAWLAECPGQPSCSCIQRVLGARCTCESANGPSVTCAP